jgi:hypothetical protein
MNRGNNAGNGMKAWSGAGLVIAGMAMLPAGHAAEQVNWDAGGGSSAVYAVGSKANFEVCAHLKQGQRVVWAFVAQAPLDFSIRDPRTKEVVAASSRNAALEARLVPAREQDYCWSWTNRAAQSTQVSLQLRRHAP